MKYIVFLIVIFTAKAQVKICSETGKNYLMVEVITLDENNRILKIDAVSPSDKLKIKTSYDKVAFRLPNHLPMIYTGKIKGEIDLTNPENVAKPYKIINGKACAIFGDFNDDFAINAMDLHIANKYISRKDIHADANNDNKVNKEDIKVVMENNNKLYHVPIIK